MIVDKKELQALYLDYLKDEGYKGEVDEDGDISFKYEGGAYWIFVDAEDEKYYCVAFPCFWKLETEEEKMKALLVANSVNGQYKCGKVFLVGENEDVTAQIDLFLTDINDFKIFFRRTLGILQEMVKDFVDEMNKTD
jgi:hypothetical protein